MGRLEPVGETAAGAAGAGGESCAGGETGAGGKLVLVENWRR